MEKVEALRLMEVRAAIRGCDRCALRQHATQPVPWSGGMNREVAILGEAPGASEDKEGEPFVGPAGKLLRKLLDEAGVPTGAMLNTVCCFPGSLLKTPSVVQMQACQGHLREQMSLVDPRWLVVCGAVAYQGLRDWLWEKELPNLAISRVRGRVLALSWTRRLWPQEKTREVWVYPIYHPAAALHQPALEGFLRSDLMRLGRLIRGEEEEWWAEDCIACEEKVYRYTEQGVAWCQRHWQEKLAPGFGRTRRKREMVTVMSGLFGYQEEAR